MKVDEDIPEIDHTRKGFEKWQAPCYSGELLSYEERYWHPLPAAKEGKISWISRIAAQVLRHENLHDLEDGSVLYKLFYQRMTEKLWDAIKEKSMQYTCSPQKLLQTVIRGADHVRYQVCWQEAKPKYPELLTAAYEKSDITPIYIRAIQGHSGPKKVKLHQMGTWEVCEKHTLTLWHVGWRHNLDSILRNGLLAGGTNDRPGRRQHCYFSIRDPRLARGRPERDGDDVASVVSTRP